MDVYTVRTQELGTAGRKRITGLGLVVSLHSVDNVIFLMF